MRMTNKKKNQISKKPYKIFPGLITWLAKNLTKSNSQELRFAMEISTKIFNILKSRGKQETIKYTKDLRLKFMTYLFQVNHKFKSEGKPWFPTSFRPIISYIEKVKSYPFIRLIFSVLYITRFIRLEPNPSFSSIETGPRKGTPPLSERDVIKFLKDIGVNTKRDLNRVPESLRWKEFHMTSKAGPNGHALWTSFLDAQALSPLQLQAIEVIGGKRIGDFISRFTNLYKRIPKFFLGLSPFTGSLSSRKLIAIPDKEGKTREVAILDYYSQAVLLPLHNKLMKQLSRINQDCTWEQTKLFNSFSADPGNSYHSIDLTAFTDRFPISVNYQILKVWFGEAFATAWMQLMVYTPFKYKGRDIYYLTGNPMGGYSSWASTSLAHHFLIFLACKRAGKSFKKCPYMLLGDDLVIGNDLVALNYKELLSDWGIDYSVPKTHVSEHGFEFAKQIRLHGYNVSPFPLAALYERYSENITSLGIILSEVTSKSWNSDVLHLVEEYYVNIKQWTRPRFTAFKPIVNLVLSLVLFLQGVSDLGIAVKQYVADSCHIDLRIEGQMLSLLGKTVAAKTLKKIFEVSRDRIVNPKTGGSLGDLATQMVMDITSLRDGGADCFDLIEAVPFLQVYGRAEEKYIKLIKQDEDELFPPEEALAWITPKDFKQVFDAIDIPIHDRDFYTRHRDVVIIQAMRSARIMIPIIKRELTFYKRNSFPINANRSQIH